MYKKRNKGFTLIELLVVVAIISLLSSVVLASLSTARGKARDARRKQDLSQIRTALFLYHDKYGDWMQTGSGCGWNGNGDGFFNVGPPTYPTYPKSMSQCLVDNGFTGGNIIDPTGGTTSAPATGFSYMKYSCGTPTTTQVFAKLEGVAQSATATDSTCCSFCDTSYGMNYYLPVQ